MLPKNPVEGAGAGAPNGVLVVVPNADGAGAPKRPAEGAGAPNTLWVEVDPPPNPPNVGAGAVDPKVDVVDPVVVDPNRDGAGADVPNPDVVVPKVEDPPNAGAGAGLPNNPIPVGAAGAVAPKAGVVIPKVVVPPPKVGCCVAVVDPPNKDGAGVCGCGA